MSDRDRSSPSLTDTPLKTYIGRHDDDYPLINGNGEFFLVTSRVMTDRVTDRGVAGAHHALALGGELVAQRAACSRSGALGQQCRAQRARPADSAHDKLCRIEASASSIAPCAPGAPSRKVFTYL